MQVAPRTTTMKRQGLCELDGSIISGQFVGGWCSECARARALGGEILVLLVLVIMFQMQSTRCLCPSSTVVGSMLWSEITRSFPSHDCTGVYEDNAPARGGSLSLAWMHNNAYRRRIRGKHMCMLYIRSSSCLFLQNNEHDGGTMKVKVHRCGRQQARLAPW